MRIRCGTILAAALVALAVGAMAGWFAAGAWGERKCGNVELWKCGNVETAKVDRARSPVSPERSEPRKRWLQGCSPDGRVCRTPARASASRTACGWGISATADAGESKVSEAELAALRDKAALLDKELKVLLDARARKAKADAQKAGGGDSQKDKPEVSADEALEKCETYGELKRRYPNVWREWHGKMSVHATRVLKKYDSWRGYMSGLDVSSMTDEERENHARMMEIYERRHALMRETELCEDDEMTVARFKENRDEMDRLDEEVRGLLVAERNTLLRITAENLGRRLGWQDADTAELAETLRAVGDVVSGDLTN